MHRLLRERETRPIAGLHQSVIHQKHFFRYITPNHTVFGLQERSGNYSHLFQGLYIQRFSPDGSRLFCFSECHRIFSIFRFLGLPRFSSSPLNDQEQYQKIMDNLQFDQMFSLEYQIPLSLPVQMFVPGLILLSHNMRFLVVACVSSGPMDNQSANSFDAYLRNQTYPFSQNTLPRGRQSRRSNPDHVVENHLPGGNCNPNNLYDLELKCIDLSNGEIVGSLTFIRDFFGKIASINSNIDIFENTICLTSLEYQSIYFVVIANDGRLLRGQPLGHYVHEDDRLQIEEYNYVEQTFSSNRRSFKRKRTGLDDFTVDCHRNSSAYQKNYNTIQNIFIEPNHHGLQQFDGSQGLLSSNDLDQLIKNTSTFHDMNADCQELDLKTPLTGLKQKILAFITQQFELDKEMNMNDMGDRFSNLSSPHELYETIKALLIAKCVYLSQQLLLIKMIQPSCLLEKDFDQNNIICYFAVFDLKQSAVLDFMDSSSESLLQIFQDFDALHGYSFKDCIDTKTYPSVNLNARTNVMSMIRSTKHAKNGGTAIAIMRAISFWPPHNQAYSDSPYFDHNLFTYDVRSVSYSERFSVAGDFPIKFFDRSTNSFLFAIGQSDPKQLRYPRSVMYHIFHPYEPLVITSIALSDRHETVWNLSFYFPFTRKPA